jgi:hypothetical protein
MFASALSGIFRSTKGAPQLCGDDSADERRLAKLKDFPAEIGGSVETVPD